MSLRESFISLIWFDLIWFDLISFVSEWVSEWVSLSGDCNWVPPCDHSHFGLYEYCLSCIPCWQLKHVLQKLAWQNYLCLIKNGSCYSWLPCVGMVQAWSLLSWTLWAFIFCTLDLCSQESSCLEFLNGAKISAFGLCFRMVKHCTPIDLMYIEWLESSFGCSENSAFMLHLRNIEHTVEWACIIWLCNRNWMRGTSLSIGWGSILIIVFLLLCRYSSWT